MPTQDFSFPAWLRRARKALGLTQRDLGQRVGCTEDLIRKLEAGRRKPSRQLAELLAANLGIPAHERETFVALARTEPAQASATTTPAVLMGNVPAAQTALFGREADLERIAAKLRKPATRLLTLTGTGGIGKTRLAMEAAQAFRADFADGVWFVALESLTSPALVLDAVAATMGIAAKDDTPAKTRLLQTIGDRRMLVVLDNFEHVLAAGAELPDVLSGCPNLALLVTSRERLKLRAEHVMDVKPLAVPAEADAPLDQLTTSPAVQLFADRAAMLVPEFEATAANIAQIAALCRQVDGLPLAIELLASRAGMHTLADMTLGLVALTTRTDLIDVPPRQQSLWNAIDWSYARLTGDEQRCFRRLAVLPGGASLDAAEAVCGVALIEHTLQSLADKSLVLRGEQSGAMRFRLHMPLREYGLAQLRALDEDTSARQAMAEHFAQRIEQLYERYATGAPNMDAQWQTLELDLDNVRAALQWADDTRNVALFVRLSSAMRRFMWVRGHTAEGTRWAQHAVELMTQADGLAEPQRTRLLADAYGTLGTYLLDAGDTQLGMAHLRNAAGYARAVGHTSRLISSLINLGNGLANQGDYDDAKSACAECAEVCERVGDAYGLADVHACLGLIAFFQGELATARDEFATALDMHRRIENTSSALIMMGNLGVVHEHLGNFAEALAFNEQSLAIARAQGMPFLIAGTAGNMAGLYVKLGQLAEARRFLSESLRVSLQVQELEFLANGLASAAKIALLAEEPEHAAAFLGMAYRVQDVRRAPFTPDNQAEVDEIRRGLAGAVGDAAVDDAIQRQAGADLAAITAQACAWLGV